MNRFALLVLVPLCFIGPVAASRTAQAAGEGTFGGAILSCFHPDASFTSVSYAHGRNNHAWTGWIEYREGRREDVAMSFEMDMKKTRDGDTFYRVLPLTDDGTTAPAAECYLREWQRY